MTKYKDLNEDYWALSRLLYSLGNEQDSCIRTGTLYQLFLNQIGSVNSAKNVKLLAAGSAAENMTNNKDLNEDYWALSRILYSLGNEQESFIRTGTLYQLFLNTIGSDNSAKNMKLLAAGSAAEGIFDFSPGDIDVMMEFSDFHCYDPQQYIRTLQTGPNIVLLEAVDENSGPGYTRLKCLNPDGISFAYKDLVNAFRCEKLDGQIFLLTNKQLLKERTAGREGRVQSEINGPAITKCSSELPGLSLDSVIAIPYYSNYLQKWTTRSFPHDWPSPELLQDISQMQGHVVAAGNKNSRHCEMEWRICFTEVEIKLSHSLNNTQLHIYILLKRIAKALLKPACSDKYISSYMIKNVVFWMAALLPLAKFQDKNLMVMMITAIKVLYGFVKRNSLPNFMIPERNLMSERMSEADREQVIKVLKEILRKGPGFLLEYSEFSDLQNRIRTARESPSTTERTVKAITELQSLLPEYLTPSFSMDADRETFIKRKIIFTHLFINGFGNEDELNEMSDEELDNLLESSINDKSFSNEMCIVI